LTPNVWTWARRHLSTDQTGNRHACCERSATHLAAHCYNRPDSAAICLGSTPSDRIAHSRSSRHAVQSSRSVARLTYHTTISNNSTVLYEPKAKNITLHYMCFTVIVNATILQYPTVLNHVKFMLISFIKLIYCLIHFPCVIIVLIFFY